MSLPEANEMPIFRDFEISLAKMESGDLSVMDSLSSVRNAIRAAISEAFKTPDVIRLFAEKQVPTTFDGLIAFRQHSAC